MTLMVKERPILFSGEMVRALLDGRKTQTRRVLTLPAWAEPESLLVDDDGQPNAFRPGSVIPEDVPCPYGMAGDRLWVRETFAHIWTDRERGWHYVYATDGKPAYICSERERERMRWTPSIHMPRVASRITLEITDVRVERLQQLTHADAMAEGTPMGIFLDLKHPLRDATFARGNPMYFESDEAAGPYDREEGDPHPDGPFAGMVEAYAALWDSLNAKRGFGWDVNPWVWVLSFRRVDG